MKQLLWNLKRVVREALEPTSLELALRAPSQPTLWLLRKCAGIQLSVEQIDAVTKSVRARPGCRFLVFGLGRDSVYWHRMNRGGKTLFLEDDPEWFEQVRGMFPFLEALKVSYSTKLPQWTSLDPALLAPPAGIPADFLQSRWDVVLVDAPTGRNPDCPGRMQSISLAEKVCEKDGMIFVHDTDRAAEAGWSDRVLGTSFAEVRAPQPTGWLRGYQR